MKNKKSNKLVLSLEERRKVWKAINDIEVGMFTDNRRSYNRGMVTISTITTLGVSGLDKIAAA
jgi:hypothetical protein